MTPLYTIWQALYMSLYSKALYLDIGRGWRGAGFRYLLLLTALCMTALTGLWMVKISRINLDVAPSLDIPSDQENSNDLSSILVHLIAQVPVITIKQGEASITQDEPYTIYYPEDNAPFAVIDTKDTHASLENTTAIILLTKDKLIYKAASNEMQSYMLKDLSQDDRVVDAYTVKEWVKHAKHIVLWLLPLVVLPLFTLIGFVYLALRSLMFGAFAMVLGMTMKVEDLKYIDYLRLSCVASTPVVVLYLLVSYFPPLGMIPFLSAVTFLLGVVYIYIAVKASR